MLVMVLTIFTPPVLAEGTWTDRWYHWYTVLKESKGLIVVLLGSCVLLALILVLVNLHIFSYRLQRQQHRFIARLNYLLDTRVVPARSTAIGITTSCNKKNSTDDEVIATV